MSKFTEGQVVSQLREKNDVNIVGQEIQILTGNSQKNDLGNKSKGKIDFLQRQCGYRVVTVDKFNK